MKPLFADTQYFAALMNAADEYHEIAMAWSREESRGIVVTEFVLLELGNTMSNRKTRQDFVRLADFLRSDPDTLVIQVSRAIYDAGLGLYRRRKDKDWSLTDCTSFVVMERNGLEEALTADHHFQQAGFKVLLL